MSNYADPWESKVFAVGAPGPRGIATPNDQFLLDLSTWLATQGWTIDNIGSSTVVQQQEPMTSFDLALSLEGWTVQLKDLGLKILLVDDLFGGSAKPSGYCADAIIVGKNPSTQACFDGLIQAIGKLYHDCQMRQPEEFPLTLHAEPKILPPSLVGHVTKRLATGGLAGTAATIDNTVKLPTIGSALSARFIDNELSASSNQIFNFGGYLMKCQSSIEAGNYFRLFAYQAALEDNFGAGTDGNWVRIVAGKEFPDSWALGVAPAADLRHPLDVAAGEGLDESPIIKLDTALNPVNAHSHKYGLLWYTESGGRRAYLNALALNLIEETAGIRKISEATMVVGSIFNFFTKDFRTHLDTSGAHRIAVNGNVRTGGMAGGTGQPTTTHFSHADPSNGSPSGLEWVHGGAQLCDGWIAMNPFSLTGNAAIVGRPWDMAVGGKTVVDADAEPDKAWDGKTWRAYTENRVGSGGQPAGTIYLRV